MEHKERNVVQQQTVWQRSQTHMKLLIICLVSSELRELAKLMKEQ